ncbi:MFS transporter [Paenibacillus sp. PAMC21692]|uniref:MFS transporter n=1 Tax=Paenibacillus sp. PAMC21692 TaxID=2762320 RepID=UPI00164E1428|nr:MFS transporter [Paenibacillus sp. PAMC21692]QNK55584.1 MFS transporter [Paenibacillus sp. PAMC21692]
MNDSVTTGQTISATAKQETLALRAFNFSTFATQSLVISFIPLYFMTKGFSESQIGVIYSAGLSVSIFANIITGLASDKYRTIRKLLVALLFAQLVLMSILYPLENVVLITIVMTCFYFFQTPIIPLSDSLILLSSQHTGTPYALIRIFGSLGFALSAYFFGLLLKGIGSEWTIALAVGTIAISIFISLFIKDYQSTARKIEFSGFFKLLGQRQVLTFFVLILMVSISHRMYEGFLAVTMRQLGASDTLIGLALLVSAASEIPTLFLLGKYGHKLRELPLLAFASLMYGLRLWLMSEINDPQWFIATQAMHSISFGIYFSTALRYLSFLIPDEYRASGQAVYTIIWTGVAGLISGVIGGVVYEHLGRVAFYHAAMYVGIAAAIGFLLYHWLGRNGR